MSSAPSVSSSITVRMEVQARPTAVSELTTAIEQVGGIVTALDVRTSGHERIGVDVTCATRGEEHANQIVAALQARRIPVTYVLYPDEGHGFVRPENALSFNAIAERFLARILGGRCEPIGDDFANSSHQIVVDAFALTAAQ